MCSQILYPGFWDLTTTNTFSSMFSGGEKRSALRICKYVKRTDRINFLYNIKEENRGINLTVLHTLSINPTTQNSTYDLDITILHMKLDTACLYFCPPMKQEMGLDKKYYGEEHFQCTLKIHIQDLFLVVLIGLYKVSVSDKMLYIVHIHCILFSTLSGCSNIRTNDKPYGTSFVHSTSIAQ